MNACEGAGTSLRTPSPAWRRLIQQSIPAVIAMQFEITDDAAATFARGFYQALARCYPVDAAVAEVRKTIFADNNETEWGTPVLYLRAPDGKIFDVQGEPGVIVPPPTSNKPTVMPETPRAVSARPVPASTTRSLPGQRGFKKFRCCRLVLGVVASLLLLVAFTSGIFRLPAVLPWLNSRCRDSDITPPSHSQQVAPGEWFKFTWKLKNSGTCQLDRSNNLIFYSGDQLEWEWERPSIILCGLKTVDVSMNIFAPSEARATMPSNGISTQATWFGSQVRVSSGGRHDACAHNSNHCLYQPNAPR